MALTSIELFERLKEIIDLPDDVVSLNIELNVNDPAFITMKVYVKDKDYKNIIVDDALVTETKRYKLVEIED